MSHGKQREEKDCLNCGHIVDERFCPHCGQENTEPRQPFHYLFTHFIEDFTHYDGQFWGTLKNLLFRPGKLTSTYLEGKRQTFVPPVKLYIFLSFITFFLFALFPPFELDFKVEKGKNDNIVLTQKNAIAELKKELQNVKTEKAYNKEDSAKIAELTETIEDKLKAEKIVRTLDMNKGLDEDFEINGYKTRHSFDSAIAKKPSRFNFINVPVYHKIFELKEKGISKGDILKNFSETSFHNLPKALFIYLPIFAFFLWLFHDKKKRWYFDHGIFTLHYFSFLLITFLSCLLIFKVSTISSITFINILLYFAIFCVLSYSVIYFYIAHKKVYNTRKTVSFIIGSAILFVNYFAFTLFLLALGIISFLMIH